MKTPTEVLTAELRGCVDQYQGAPALAVQCVAALRAAGWIVVREGALGRAQREAVAAYLEDTEKPRVPPGRLWHEAKGNIGIAS